jgi:hypothetical protein
MYHFVHDRKVEAVREMVVRYFNTTCVYNI